MGFDWSVLGGATDTAYLGVMMARLRINARFLLDVFYEFAALSKADGEAEMPAGERLQGITDRTHRGR